MNQKQIVQLFRRKARVRLDIGCGERCQDGWVGMDKRKCKGVDIVHDVQDLPWPIPDTSVFQVKLAHVWEHIEPRFRIEIMDEIWRIIEPDGQLIIVSPYATSHGAFQDPSHYGCPNETTFHYFDPGSSTGLFNIYKAKPWKLKVNTYQLNGNIEILLEPRKS